MRLIFQKEGNLVLNKYHYASIFLYTVSAVSAITIVVVLTKKVLDAK